MHSKGFMTETIRPEERIEAKEKHPALAVLSSAVVNLLGQGNAFAMMALGGPDGVDSLVSESVLFAAHIMDSAGASDEAYVLDIAQEARRIAAAQTKMPADGGGPRYSTPLDAIKATTGGQTTFPERFLAQVRASLADFEAKRIPAENIVDALLESMKERDDDTEEK